MTDGEARVRRPVMWVVWCVALLAATGLFHALGSGLLAAPPFDPAAWGAWLDERDPLVATAALLRLAAVTACWYLIGATAIGSFARLRRAARLLRFADAVTVPAVQRLLHQTLGVAVAAAVATSASSVGGATSGAPAMVLAAVGTEDDRGPAIAAAPTTEEEAGAPSVTLRGLPVPAIGDPAPSGPGAAPPPRVPLPWQVGVGQATAADGISASRHVVRSGESLWRIASTHLQLVLDRAPSDAEVVPYWRELIEANRDRLPDRDDPDLILPGQELVLPSVAP